MGSSLVQLVRHDSRVLGCDGELTCVSWAILFAFTVPIMIKVWVVKTAFLFVGLGIP